MNGNFNGILNKIVKSDGSAYENDNWRLDYLGLKFVAQVINSELFEGKVMIKFIDVDDSEHFIRTGVGDLSWNEDLTKGILASSNSVYYFTRESKGFTFYISKLEG